MGTTDTTAEIPAKPVKFADGGGSKRAPGICDRLDTGLTLAR
jgi:hypothetical protein